MIKSGAFRVCDSHFATQSFAFAYRALVGVSSAGCPDHAPLLARGTDTKTITNEGAAARDHGRGVTRTPGRDTETLAEI
eukprot:401056-Pyramimonas_sp.AAC.1